VPDVPATTGFDADILRCAADHAARHYVAPHDATEDVNQHCLNGCNSEVNLNAASIPLLRRAAAHARSGTAACELGDYRRHRESRAVELAGDAATSNLIVKIELRGPSILTALLRSVA